MLKKVWFMLVLCSVLMVSGCSGGMPKNNMDSVAVSGDVVSDLIMAEAEQVETTVTEEQSGDSSNVEASNTEEPTVDTTTTETDTEPSTTEAPSEPETVTTEPATSPEEQQPTTPEQTPHRLHPQKFLQRKMKRHLLQMTEVILLTVVRCLRLHSTYRRQNMWDMMQTVWLGLLWRNAKPQE